jgi:hypothetical protein
MKQEMPVYDPELYKDLPNSDPTHAPVFNPLFREWKDHITLNLRIKDRYVLSEICSKTGLKISVDEIDNYSKGPYSVLYAECREHAEKYSKPLTSPNLVVVVHPFYSQLCDMKAIVERGLERNISRYRDNLMNLLKEFPRDRANLVFFETIHHYAAATSLFLEAGMVDNVLFTQFDDGLLVNTDDLEGLEDKTFYLAGGYNGFCLKKAAYSLKSKVTTDQVWAVEDVIVSPISFDYCRINPDFITFGRKYVQKSRRINSKDLIQRLKETPDPAELTVESSLSPSPSAASGQEERVSLMQRCTARLSSLLHIYSLRQG